MTIPPSKPGYLLHPFGWAAPKILRLLETQPQLATQLCKINWLRIQFIALALAHLADVPLDLATLLFTGPLESLGKTLFGDFRSDIMTILSRMQTIISQDNYRRLMTLCKTETSLQLLLDYQYITETCVEILHGLPVALQRSFILHGLTCYDERNMFQDGLRFLITRGAADEFESLVNELSLATDDKDFSNILRRITERLPLPSFPPAQIGSALRIDKPDALRSLDRQWHTSVMDEIENIDSGTTAIYVAENDSSLLLCCVKRIGRLGWFVANVTGPKGVKVDSLKYEETVRVFSEAGIPDYSVIAAIRMLTD